MRTGTGHCVMCAGLLRLWRPPQLVRRRPQPPAPARNQICSPLALWLQLSGMESGRQGVAPGEQVSGEIVREIDDPHTGDRWLLLRNAEAPGGPGRLVLDCGSSTMNPAAQPDHRRAQPQDTRRCCPSFTAGRPADRSWSIRRGWMPLWRRGRSTPAAVGTRLSGGASGDRRQSGAGSRPGSRPRGLSSRRRGRGHEIAAMRRFHSRRFSVR
jgi:hypothetical protein